MSGRSELLILDTNIVIHLIRDNEAAKRVTDNDFDVLHPQQIRRTIIPEQS